MDSTNLELRNINSLVKVPMVFTVLCVVAVQGACKFALLI